MIAGLMNWLQEMGKRLFSAALISLVTVVLLALLAFIFRAYYNTPPFSVFLLTQPPVGILCPGDIYEGWVEIESSGTTIIFIYITNQMPNGNHVTHPDQPIIQIIPVGNKVRFEQSFKWVVPDVQPGLVNQRVLGFRGHDTDEDPIVVSTDFVVASKQQCLAREKTK